MFESIAEALASARAEGTLAVVGNAKLASALAAKHDVVPIGLSPRAAKRLTNALAGRGTYDQNTFYRLMSQLGTDSLPANRNKLNLNYDNVNRLGQIDPTLVAGFTNWTPIRFFTNAAAAKAGPAARVATMATARATPRGDRRLSSS